MKNYIGSKIIQAKLTNMKEYKKEKYGEKATIEENDENVECYIIVYPPIGNETKPYISFSPKEIFEKVYREIENAEISLMNGFFEGK